VSKDEARAFALASSGAALGCAHSKGTLSFCVLMRWARDRGGDADLAKGLALGRDSAAAGSCFGQFLQGWFSQLGVKSQCVFTAPDYRKAAKMYTNVPARGGTGARRISVLLGPPS
jgi:hypothetical protein